MLYILFSAIIIIPVLLGSGRFFEIFFGKIFSGISGTLILGTMSVSLIWTVLSFFFPLNIYVEVTTILLGFAGFFYFKENIKIFDFINENKLIFFSLSIIILFFGSFYPFILDHFGYYVPSINWLKDFGLAKGISNLDLLLGQMSVWHIFQAGFSNFTDSFLRINSIVLLIYLIYSIERKSWIQLCFLPVLFLFIQSPSPDLPVIAFSLMILNEIFNRNRNAAYLFCFSVFIFAIKPTMIWLPIFTFLYSFVILRRNLKFLLGGSLILILFFIKNIWTFGFPVFPVQILDFGISWKPNAEILKQSSESAIMKTYDLQYSYEQISRFTLIQYIKNWFFLEGIKSKINSLFILSLIFFGVFTLIKKEKILVLLFISVLIKSIIVLLFSAQYRFFLDVFFAVVFVLLYKSMTFKKSIFIFSVLSFFCAFFLSFPDVIRNQLPSFKLGHYMMGITKDQFVKPAYFELNKYKTYQIGNLKFNVVEEYPFSYDTPNPSINPDFLLDYINAEIIPQKIGKDLKDGFIWRKITPQEKKKMEQILENHLNSYKNQAH